MNSSSFIFFFFYDIVRNLTILWKLKVDPEPTLFEWREGIQNQKKKIRPNKVDYMYLLPTYTFEPFQMN